MADSWVPPSPLAGLLLLGAPPSPPCCYTWVPPSPLADSWVPPSPLTELLLLGTPVAFGRARRLGSRRGAAATAAFQRVLTYLPGSRLLRPQPLAIRPDLPSGSQYFCRDLASPSGCGRRSPLACSSHQLPPSLSLDPTWNLPPGPLQLTDLLALRLRHCPRRRFLC